MRAEEEKGAERLAGRSSCVGWTWLWAAAATPAAAAAYCT